MLRLAIEKEEDAVRFYTQAAEIVTAPGTNEMLRSFITEEQKHVSLLSEARSGKSMEAVGQKSLPTSLDLTRYLVGGDITPASTAQDVMIIAMKKEDSAVAFYSDLGASFAGSEVEGIFQSLCKMEKEHKEQLEAEYEKHFMPDN